MELKFPEQEDLLRFAEGVPARDPKLEQQIKQILATNNLVRKEMAEIKKELYRLECQLPNYQMGAEFGAEIAKMAHSWCAVRARQRLSFKNFWAEKEFLRVLWILLAALACATLLSRLI